MASQPLCEEMLIESVLSVLASKKTVRDDYQIDSELCQNATHSALFVKDDQIQVKMKEPNVCPICIEELDSSICVLGCGHMFHSKCEEEWRARSGMCSVCREEVTFYSLVDDYWAHPVSTMTVTNLRDVMTRAQSWMDECKVCKEKQASAGDFLHCDHTILIAC